MPTYRNDLAAGDLLIAGTNGAAIRLKPGESGESYLFYDTTGLTKTSDSPVKQPVAAQVTATNSTGAAATIEATIGNDIQKVWVEVETAGITVDVYLQFTADNVPSINALTSTDGPYELTIDGAATKLALAMSGAGTVVVTPYPM